ncbi:response regulator transcription factor [Telmatospirillum sp. J64-1]|uniref:response regulator transcription factor n=1 Tax=Telmatospirillum sp. J64-1 TaxID=2502183 RepID=UPI00115CB6E6|nr:response regulator transcription factor [Telmatospirillum sp. J64-1]
MRTLLVEDNRSLAESLEQSLTGLGLAVDHVSAVSDAIELLEAVEFDLAVLDLNLTDGDGLDILRHVRQRNMRVAVLILTARSGIKDRVLGLDLGADDYLAKPFDLDEFEARIRALSRRLQSNPSPVIELGRLRFDTVTRDIVIEGAQLDLPARERALFAALIRRPGKVVLKEQLVQQLSSYKDELAPSVVELYVHRLRRRLAGSGVTLKTIRGLGYILEA